MGHPQPLTPVQVENSTAVGFCNDKIKHRCSKAIDMRFHWVKDRVKQGQVVIYWPPGSQNELADYVTKHHPASHHIEMRPQFFLTQHLANVVVSQLLQGCDNCPKTRAARASAIQTKQLLFNSYDGYQNANRKWDSNQVQTATYS